ncbi:MAG: ABC transporter substrate-binding protein [Clostridiales bacterium]|nr:ABC transporter substrate-binding protein [Clostridiales bacterium]
MKKIISTLASILLILSTLIGCNSSSKEDQVATKIGVLKGPTAMGMIKLMDDKDKYDITISGSVDEVTPKIVNGEYDICAIPANLSSVLYNNTEGDVVVLAINTLGVLYIVENGNTINSINDLKGKTIYVSGKGATPEYSLNYLLKANNIDPEKDVNIEFKSEHSECLQAVMENENGIAMLPEPFVTTAKQKSDKLRVAIDMNKEWENLQGDNGGLITGVVICRRDFLKEHPEKIKEFLKDYNESVDFVKNNNDEAAKLIGEKDIVSENVAKIAIPNCNITYLDGDEMKNKLEGYLKILYNQNPKAIGGNLPNEDFYYSSK